MKSPRFTGDFYYIPIKKQGDHASWQKQENIPETEAEKAENKRKPSQLQHKKQQLENRINYYEKEDRRKRRTADKGFDRNRALHLCGKSSFITGGQGLVHGSGQRTQPSRS